MVKVRIGNGLLDSLVMPGGPGVRQSPSSRLRQILEAPGFGLVGGVTPSTLMLLAVYARLAQCVLLDAGLPIPISAAGRRLASGGKGGWLEASRLHFLPAVARTRAAPFLRTHRFLGMLPRDFARALVAWAPPVVSPPTSALTGNAVLGNLFTAFIATQLLPQERIRVVMLPRAQRQRVTLVDVAMFAHPLLDPIARLVRRRIAVNSPSILLGCELSGYHRAWVFRLRQRAQAGPAL